MPALGWASSDGCPALQQSQREMSVWLARAEPSPMAVPFQAIADAVGERRGIELSKALPGQVVQWSLRHAARRPHCMWPSMSVEQTQRGTHWLSKIPVSPPTTRKCCASTRGSDDVCLPFGTPVNRSFLVSRSARAICARCCLAPSFRCSRPLIVLLHIRPPPPSPTGS